MLGPYATMLPPGLSPDPSLLTPSALEKNLRWRARNDVVRIGRNRVRTYRLDMSFAGHVEAGVQVSRAGEILRVQLPGNLQLVGDAFLGLEQPATPAP
jgi:hypothetical protein